MIEFSIVIINYNYAKYLKDCLQSCFKQNIKKNFEIIFIDDGSTDNSLNIAKKFKKKNYKIYKTKNLGIERSANLGFKKSKGKYIVRVDSDDMLKKNYLLSMRKIIKKYNKSAFFYSNYDVIDENNKLIIKKKLPKFSTKEIFRRGDFLATGTLVSRELILKYGGYIKNKKNCGLENYDLILRLIKNKHKGFHLDQNLFFLRNHKQNISIIKYKKIKSFGQKLLNKLKIGKYNINKNHPLNY